MLNLQLYIEGQEVDLFKDESVTLTQSLQDVKDIAKVFTDFSRTFSVPASRTNNKIFGHFYNYHIVGDSAFDARKKKTAQLYLNYELFKEGKVKFQGATKKDNKAHTYKITFFGNGVNLKDLMGEDKIKSLPLLKNDAFKFTYNDANIKTYLKSGLDITVDQTTYTDAILFPLITHTKRLIYNSDFTDPNSNNTDKINNIAFENLATDNGLLLSELKPALRIHTIIKAIEHRYGITFSTDFFSDTNEPFYNLYMWMHNKTGGLFEDEGNESPVGGFTLNSSKGAVIDLFDNYFDTPQADQAASGSRRGKKQRILDVSIYPSISSEFSFIIYKNGIVFEEYKDVQRDGSSLRYEIRDLNIDAGTYTFAVDTGTQSTYDIDFDVRINNANRANFSGTASVLSNAQLRVANQLPDIKVLDFLTSLFKMFNLTSFQNSDGIVEVKTLDSFYSSSTTIWDITEFIDKSESSVDTVLPFKQVDFSYEGLKNFFANNHLELFNRKWGAENYTAEDLDKIEGETYTVSVPLEHFKYERLKDQNGGSFKDLLFGWSVDIKQEPNLGKPLLFYPILSTQDIGVLNSDGSKSQQTDVFIPSNSVRLSDSKNLNFSAEPNEYLGTPFKKTLFAEYYKNYIKEIFDAQRRLTTVKAYLPISMTLDLSLADKIRIFENLYKINKITTSFETNQSTLELINVKPTAGESITIDPIIPDKFLPNSVCITADTTVYFADSTILTADADCDVEGLEIKSTTEVIPTLLDTGNKPLVDDHTTTLPVTKASVTINSPSVISNNTMILSATINELGTLGRVKQLDQYGFFYSTTQSDIAPDDISVIRGTAGATEIKFDTTQLNKRVNPATVQAGITSLSANQTIFYRFYVFTNTDTQFTVTSVLSDIKQATTTS
tara:strand:+ start:200 stop:2878 length:2679 start_codon:yes stop_codon:yes gene_type:complete